MPSGAVGAHVLRVDMATLPGGARLVWMGPPRPPACMQVELPAPRPLREFFGNWGPPQKQKQYFSRLKANAFYYRTNYLVLSGLAVSACFVRNPGALLALATALLTLLLANDPFALSFK